MYDVHIIGAGPAGCAAGLSACMQGKKVLISEEHKNIGIPEACSGLVSESGLQSFLPYVNYKKITQNIIKSAKFYLEGYPIEIYPKKEKAILISRYKLDQLFAEAFENQGGKIELGKKITREFKSKNIIGADGPASAIADFFGFPKIKKFVFTIQGNYKYSSEDPNQAQLFFSSKRFPGFFGWIIPIDEYSAKIGIGVSSKFHPLKYYLNFLSYLKLKRNKSEFSAVIPVSIREKTAMKKSGYNVILAGDSAGQVKATTGGGIYFGANCAKIAGENSNYPFEYERKWKEIYGKDLYLHQSLRNLLDIFGGCPPLPKYLVLFSKALLLDRFLEEQGRMDKISNVFTFNSFVRYISILKERYTK
jgi:geranylgeranyl reductase family protein